MAKLKRMTADDLDALAQKIRWVADRYAGVGSSMRERGIPALDISGIDTVINEIIPNRLNANAGSAERALHLWDGTPEFSDVKPANLAAEAKETFRQSKSRTKKKGD